MSKGLEALRDILGILSAVSGCEVDMNSERIQTITKELKALEILKEKRVNIGCFYHVVFVLKKDYESCKLNNNIMYNICDTEKEFLTQEEFDLLIEVFYEMV